MVQFVQYKIGEETIFEVPSRYSQLELIGNGSHGTVCSAHDSVSSQKVAIKKLSSPFNSKRSAQRVYRELSLMKHCTHPNIMKVLEVFIPQSTVETMCDIYIVMEYMELTLKQALSEHKLSLQQISHIVYQIACGLKFLQALGIWHRDLKPANIAVTKDLSVKILDFGLARVDESEESIPSLTFYIVTRWYRAPEVILGLPYNGAVDVWSLGCVMGEMILQRGLFMGNDEIDQWHKITQRLGMPPPEMLQRCDDKVREYIESANNRTDENIEIFEEIRHSVGTGGELESDPGQCTVEQAVECLKKMLVLDPNIRSPITELIEHPFLSKYRWTPFEVLPDPALLAKVKDFQRHFNNKEWSITKWKEIIYNFIVETWHSTEQQSQTKVAEPPIRDTQLQGPGWYPKNLSSNLTALSPLAGLAVYAAMEGRYLDRTKPALCGVIVFAVTLTIARMIKHG